MINCLQHSSIMYRDCISFPLSPFLPGVNNPLIFVFLLSHPKFPMMKDLNFHIEKIHWVPKTMNGRKKKKPLHKVHY